MLVIKMPPFDPPSAAIRPGRVTPRRTRSAAIAAKSSWVRRLPARRPASCQRVPNSPPPRILALTLVPPHHLWELKQGFECRATVWQIEVDYRDRDPPLGYTTIFPALALCIAALRARGVE